MKNSKLFKIILFLIIVTLSSFGFCQTPISARKNENTVKFSTTDTALKNLFDLAEAKAAENVKVFSPTYTVLIEGGEYPFVWVETQPMGGVMYAKRNLEVAYNNIAIFLNNQLDNGRVPGMIIPMSNNIWGLTGLKEVENGKLGIFSETLQGFFVPGPSLELYYLLGRDDKYLDLLYKSYKAYDNYLWKYRDSDGDGCLEAWCQTDSGEDYLVRYNYAPFVWPFNFPPVEGKMPADSAFIKKWWPKDFVKGYTHAKNPMPVESIDVMGYSFTCRDALAKISALQKNGQENYWRSKANIVRNKMNTYLWVPERNAYFYRNKFNQITPTLTHNNLRAMYFGSMTQPMANAFIKHHLLNPKEFWTYMPLTSIAANDPDFRNISHNNWSGQPEGLTYQRAITALENYSHFAEVTLLGHKLLNTIGKSKKFTQQFDPFTAAQNGSDGYGPTVLSVLEYYSRMYGVYTKNDTMHFNGLGMVKSYTYSQTLKDKTYTILQKNNQITGYLNNKLLFKSTAGVKVSTNKLGKIISVSGIDTLSRNIIVKIGKNTFKGLVKPNGVYTLQNGKLKIAKKTPFNYPYKACD